MLTDNKDSAESTTEGSLTNAELVDALAAAGQGLFRCQKNLSF
jgi:hypothetical protein